jgi:ATP-dependent DNA helicase RecQ
MDDARRALREHFGFEDFRPGQADAVAAALAGRDALVVMPPAPASRSATSCPRSCAPT